MFGVKTIRKLLLTAVVVALAATPVAAEADADCWETERHGDEDAGLFCVDGSKMEVCRDRGGNCVVSCGKKWVPVNPCERPK